MSVCSAYSSLVSATNVESALFAHAAHASPQVILVAPDRFAAGAPPGMIVRPFVPQLALRSRRERTHKR